MSSITDGSRKHASPFNVLEARGKCNSEHVYWPLGDELGSSFVYSGSLCFVLLTVATLCL
jgi:hypothetical protein